MTSFIDLYLDDQIAGWPCRSSPRFSTTVTSNSAGGEYRNRNWLHPLHRFTLPEAIREHAQFEAIHDHWLIMGGREATFPFRDPLDFASRALTIPNVIPEYDGDDQLFATGDGLTRVFQLTKTYTRGGYSYTRNIYFPIEASLLLLVNGASGLRTPEFYGYTYAVARVGGTVTFTPALAVGHTAHWGGLFDVQVRFERDDSFDGIVQNYRVSGFSDLIFVETRYC